MKFVVDIDQPCYISSTTECFGFSIQVDGGKRSDWELMSSGVCHSSR